MSQDNFSGGFFLGTIVGGVVGGVIGALFASGRLTLPAAEEDLALDGEGRSEEGAGGPLKRLRGDDRDMESARRSLEDKIAQLNEAIDDVRQQLGGVNGTIPKPEDDRIGIRDRS